MLIGSSYAYLTYISKTNNSVVIKAGTLALNFKNQSNSITLNNALPISDKDGLSNTNEYEFTVENTGTINANYKIRLDNTCVIDKTFTVNGENIKPDKCIPNKYIKVALKEGEGDYKVLEKAKKEGEIGDYQISGAKQNDDGISFNAEDENNYIDIGNANYEFNNKLTVGARFKTNSYSSSGRVLIDNYTYVNGKQIGFEFYVANNGKIVLQFFGKTDNSRQRIVSNTVTELNTWSIAVATYDGETIKMYINGKLDKTLEVDSNIINSINSKAPIYIGASPYKGGSFFYDGTISDAMVINDVLGDKEIEDNYNETFDYKTNKNTLFYKNFTNNNYFVLDSDSINATSEKTYKMKIWLDYDTPNAYNSKGGLNILYIGKLGLSYEQGNNITPNRPILSSNMIPVYYDETSEVWKKADEKNQDEKNKWYDYNNKMWANSVTVSSANRETYKRANVGTEIPMDDILTMEVWIPRYKYKIWNYNANGNKYSNPRRIEIEFEKGIGSTGTTKCVDDLNNINGTSESCYDNINNGVRDNLSTYTHPAFTFGDEELTGFWVGKFELTGDINNITTKPNLSSVRTQNVSGYETNIMKMNDNSNAYGFNTNDDIHMIKNMEWGAVAYLSHSKYGTCSGNNCIRMGKNNNSNYFTGCGDVYNAKESETCNSYETNKGKTASTTGNIYGLYDMSGGTHEYTMGNTIYQDGETMISGYSDTENSGYKGITYSNKNYTSVSGFDYPNEKYYDKYSFGNYDDIKRGKLGDASKETRSQLEASYGNWYGQNLRITSYGASWSLRGASKAHLNSAGIFAYNYHYGNNNDYSTRFVISSNSTNKTENLCNFTGPYSSSSLNTQVSEYAYDGDKIYYKLTCLSNNDINNEQLKATSLKSSNKKLLKVNKIISKTKVIENNKTGYSYIIESEAQKDDSNIEKAYLYIEPSTIIDQNKNVDNGSRSKAITIGLLRTNKQNNAKPILTCNSISKQEQIQMEQILNNKINKASLGTRQAVVEAARFLANNFPYVIPYYWTDGIKNYPDSGHYPKKGFYLNEDRAWGCNIEKVQNEMGIFKIGNKYPNGLECSGYVIWALTNGGFGKTGQWYSEIFKERTDGGLYYQNTYNPNSHSLGYSNIFDYYMSDSTAAKTASDTWKKLSVSSKKCIRESCGVTDTSIIENYEIKAGDLIWKEGHIGMITGIRKGTSSNVYCVAEATYTVNNSGGFSNRGLRTICYTTSELNKSSTGWTHIIKMDDIYGTGNLTNYKPYW